jgi:LysM repeat protein
LDCATRRYIRGDLGEDGLTITQLQAFNPDVDPLGLVPGERLNLWRHPPKPRPKPLGPRFSTVRGGESFGSIAAKTGINIVTLEQLNPRLKPATLQPGDRVRLRR